jgi:hypothetical protein
MDRASAPAAPEEMEGIMGNATDKETEQASLTALANWPDFFLLVSTGGGSSSAAPAASATGTTTSAALGSKEAVRTSSPSPEKDDMAEAEECSVSCFACVSQGASKARADGGELLADAKPGLLLPRCQTCNDQGAVSGEEANALNYYLCVSCESGAVLRKGDRRARGTLNSCFVRTGFGLLFFVVGERSVEFNSIRHVPVFSFGVVRARLSMNSFGPSKESIKNCKKTYRLIFT